MSSWSFGLLTLLFVGIGAGLYGWQAVEALDQHRRISTFRPVEATVHTVRVDMRETRTSKGGRSVTYAPIVHYEYEVDGRMHSNTQVLPKPHTGSSEWASEIASRFVEGEPCEAYYDPANPEDAFLVKEYRFLFYGLALLGVAIACIPFVIWSSMPRTQPLLVPPATDGWREAPVARTMRQRISASFLAAAAVNAGWVVTLGHYVWVAGPAETTLLYLSASAGLVAGLIPVWTMVRTLLLSRAIGEARVLLQPAPVLVGKRFQVRVEQDLRVDANVEEVVVELVCDQTAKRTSGGKTRTETSEIHRASVQVVPARLFGPGESITATAELQVPAQLDGTWLPSNSAYPRNAWRVEVDTKLSGAPDYRGRFPILVEPA